VGGGDVDKSQVDGDSAYLTSRFGCPS